MPEIDEVVLHDLMHRATDDLHAPSAVTAGIVSLHRRRRVRARLMSVGATGAAAGIVAGVLASGNNSPAAHSTAGPNNGTINGTIKLTAAQRTLYHLSDAAAATSRPAGRYVVMHEKQTTQAPNGGEESSENIDVINTVTGGGLTYQDYHGAPHQLSDSAGTTQAQYDAMPTGATSLRAFLLSQAKQQDAQADKIMNRKLKQEEKTTGHKLSALPNPTPLDNSTLVYEQATYTLWSPLLSPALRSALYKVLAATPGVVVKTGAHDAMGRPAVEISHWNRWAHEYSEVFDNPSTGATLETADVTPANPALHITASYGSDLYQSITRTNTIPPNPYR
jgi:hypothetical protein